MNVTTRPTIGDSRLAARLRRETHLSFAELVRDASGSGEVVARFLALLELYRSQAVAFEQIEPLGPLQVRWVAVRWNDEILASLGAEYDH